MDMMVVQTVSVRARPLFGRSVGKGLTRAVAWDDFLIRPARQKDTGSA